MFERLKTVGTMAACLVGVDQGDDFDVGVVEVGPHVQVVDAAETDEGGADRAVIRREAHGALFLISGATSPGLCVNWTM